MKLYIKQWVFGVIMCGIILLLCGYIINRYRLISIPTPRTYIKNHEKITRDDLHYVQMPKNMIPKDTLTTVDEIIDKYVLTDFTLMPNQPILMATLGTPRDTQQYPLYILRDDEVLYNFKIDMVQSGGNLLRVGNYIHVYRNTRHGFDERSVERVLENSRVLLVRDQNGNDITEQHDTPYVIGIAVNIKDIEKMIQATHDNALTISISNGLRGQS